MNIRELLNGSHNSEDGSMDEKAGKKRDSDLPEPVEWTDGNLQKIVNALVIRGYGNWEGISKESKLNWSDYDIAHGARLALLQLLKWSCMALPASQSASTTNTTDSEPTSDTPPPQSQSQGQCQSQSQSSSTSNDQAADAVYEFAPDNKYLTAFLRKSRACWMAVACQNRDPVDMTDQTTRVDTETEGDKSLVENQLLRDTFDTYQFQRSSLLVTAADGGVAIDGECGNSKTDLDRDSLKSYYEAYDRLCCLGTSTDLNEPKQQLEGDSMAVEGDQEAISVPAPIKQLALAILTAEAVVTVLSRLELPSAFANVPVDRVLKTRTAARAKLSQIEDLFELHLLAQLLEPTAATAMLVSDDMAIVEEAATDQAPTTTHVSTDSAIPGVPVIDGYNTATAAATTTASGHGIVGISAVLSPLSLDQWTCEEDTRLIRLVDKVCGHSP